MRLFLLLAPLVAFAGPPRFARLGEIEGRVEVRLAPVDAWVEANAAGFNAAIPLPARTGLSAVQKARLLAMVVQRRFERS